MCQLSPTRLSRTVPLDSASKSKPGDWLCPLVAENFCSGAGVALTVLTCPKDMGLKCLKRMEQIYDPQISTTFHEFTCPLIHLGSVHHAPEVSRAVLRTWQGNRSVRDVVSHALPGKSRVGKKAALHCFARLKSMGNRAETIGKPIGKCENHGKTMGRW